jgi:hypothetical protein
MLHVLNSSFPENRLNYSIPGGELSIAAGKTKEYCEDR